MVADHLGDAGHPAYAPGTIRSRLEALPKDAPVLGIARVHAAVKDRQGAMHDGTYDDTPGP